MSCYLIETMTFVASWWDEALAHPIFFFKERCQFRPISWNVNSGSAPVQMCSYFLRMAQSLMCIMSSSDGHMG